MKLQEIKAIAQEKGVKPGSMKKADLIRAIQRAEGNKVARSQSGYMRRSATSGRLQYLLFRSLLQSQNGPHP